MEELIANSETFNKKNKFPIHSVRLKELAQKFPTKIHRMEDFARSARPIVHEDVLDTMVEFLRRKSKEGSNIEKRIYHEMSIPDFVQRLISKRPLSFIGARDSYILRDGEGRGRGGFETIGRDGIERFPLIMENYLTYDEIKLSALLGTSSYTLSINIGDRHNEGYEEPDQSKYVNEALIIGLVGPRLKKKGVMERQELVIDRNSSPADGPMKQLYNSFYKVNHFPNYEESLKMKDRMVQLSNNSLFDTQLYKRRIQITAETLLWEANHRAGQLGKKAYVHIVGLGLGLWKICQEQDQLYVDVFGDFVLRNHLPHISDLDFSWIPVSNVCGASNDEMINNVRFHISRRNFFEPLKDNDKLLVVSWAYDGNSYPGNEFWKGSLSGSGDSQAAASTQVSELHNPQINPWFSGSNLHVVSGVYHGVYEYKEFMKKYKVENR